MRVGVLDLLSKQTYHELSLVYHDMGSRVLLVYEEIYNKYSKVMKVTQGYRSIEDQDRLYAQGRTTPGAIVTNAMGGQSWHNYGFAVDSCFVGEDPYLEKHEKGQEIWAAFGKACRDNGLAWGGDFRTIKDSPHCEKRYDQTLESCKILVGTVGIKGLWAQLDSKLQQIHIKETMH